MGSPCVVYDARRRGSGLTQVARSISRASYLFAFAPRRAAPVAVFSVFASRKEGKLAPSVERK
eukprot:4387149-Pyramimonas_sp.AAC.1